MLRARTSKWLLAVAMVAGSPGAGIAGTDLELQKPIRELVAQLVDGAQARRKGPMRVAVMPFDLTSEKVSNLGVVRAVEDLLVSSFLKDGRYQVVERKKLDLVVKELDLTMKVADPKTAKRIGAILGTDALVVGQIEELGDRVMVSARMVDAEDGEVLSSAQGDLSGSSLQSSGSRFRFAEKEGVVLGLLGDYWNVPGLEIKDGFYGLSFGYVYTNGNEFGLSFRTGENTNPFQTKMRDGIITLPPYSFDFRKVGLELTIADLMAFGLHFRHHFGGSPRFAPFWGVGANYYRYTMDVRDLLVSQFLIREEWSSKRPVSDNGFGAEATLGAKWFVAERMAVSFAASAMWMRLHLDPTKLGPSGLEAQVPAYLGINDHDLTEFGQSGQVALVFLF